VGHQGCLKAGLSAVALCAAFAANAAPTSVAPACTASLTQPSWADCAGAFSGDGRFDSAIDDPIYLEADGAPNASIDFTSVGVNIQASGAGNGASQAPMSAPSTVAAIPEPHTSLLLLAGLAAIGFMATRRRRP
jgi:hypothetical protein